MNISCHLTLTPDLKTFLRHKLKGHKLSITDKLLTKDNLNKKTEILGVFVDSKVTKAHIKNMPKLKLIVTFSTGFDHIDLKEAKRRGITVCNVPTYGENTVAEYAVGLMLTLTRKLYATSKRVKEGVFDYHGLRGMDIKGKTIGVIGTGHIGVRFIEMLHGFHANIIAFDKFPNKELPGQYNFQYVPLNTLIKKSDIISLHLPLFPSTKHIINKSAIKKMKKGVIIINTARGGLIDAEALLWGLEKNIIGGAGLDVIEGEDLLEDRVKVLCKECSPEMTRLGLMNSMLIDHERTIITPHNAFNSIEAVKRIIKTSCENINSYIEGTPQNQIKRK